MRSDYARGGIMKHSIHFVRLIYVGLFLSLFTNAAQARVQDSEQYPTQVRGLNVSNAHKIKKTKYIYRGSAPLGKAEELVQLGIEKVLIFKNQTRKEVDTEIAQLTDAGISRDQIYNIDFLWKDIKSFEYACEQTVDALQILIDAETNNEKIFFHCTAGQDRTGYLAALFRLLRERVSEEEVVADEMCEKGYAEGNPYKPANVVDHINRNLSPLFLVMAQMIVDEEITIDNLDKSACKGIEVEDRAVSLCR